MPSISEIMEKMDYGPAPEAADFVTDWLERHKAGFGHFIGGAFTKPGAGFEVSNPASGAVLGRVTQGSERDVTRAVAAARKAQKGWAALTGDARARHLYALARHVQKRARFLAVLESLNNGKPIRESRDIDVPLVVRHLYHHAGWAAVLADEFPGMGPVGVCGQIIPWNFPLLMLAWKIAPALAAGNTLVLKPAEYTPLTALAFAEICREAGLPPGVVNIVTGDGATGALLVEAEVDKIAFTGSTEVGRGIRRATAGTGKRLTLELGGKSPFIVFADADQEAAVEGVVDAIWFNQGEVCCAGSRILVQEGVAAAFTERLRRRMATMRLGDPLDKSIDMGAVVHPVQLDRIRALVEQAQAEGAVLHQPQAPLPGVGCYFPPSLLSGVTPASTVWREEIFGPVATLTQFRTPQEAVELANNSAYGLAASIWSENVNLCLDVASRIKAGVVWINATNLFDAGAPFGGYRESGFGREGGREGMWDYLAPLEKTPLKGVSGTFSPALSPAAVAQGAGIDRTPKLYIGGKQVRPDGGNSYSVTGRDGAVLGQAPLGNRKDIRNAVEAAHKASGWAAASGHARAQVLYYLAENLSERAGEFSDRLAAMGSRNATQEVETSVRRAFWYAAQADKFDGRTRPTQSGHLTLALPEPFGVMGLVCPDAPPLLGFLSLVLPAISMGNRVVAIPSAPEPLAALDFVQVLETSDVPGGVVNIVTGARDDLARTLADHDDIAAMWYFNGAEGSRMVEEASAGNLKSTWVTHGAGRDWASAAGQGQEFLRRATQVKTIWVPYGE